LNKTPGKEKDSLNSSFEEHKPQSIQIRGAPGNSIFPSKKGSVEEHFLSTQSANQFGIPSAVNNNKRQLKIPLGKMGGSVAPMGQKT
jgi:hypothetical protein